MKHLQDPLHVSWCSLIDYSQALYSQILLEQHLPLRHNWRRSEKQKAVGHNCMFFLCILFEIGDFPTTSLDHMILKNLKKTKQNIATQFFHEQKMV